MDAAELELEEIRERIRREVAAWEVSQSKRDDVAARFRLPSDRVPGAYLSSGSKNGKVSGAPASDEASGAEERVLDRLRNSVTDALRRHFGNKKLSLKDSEPKPGFFSRLFRKQGAFNKAVITAWRHQLTLNQKLLPHLQTTHKNARRIEALRELLVDEFSGLHDALRTEREDRMTELERLREQIRNDAWKIKNLAEEFGAWRHDVARLRAQTSEDDRIIRALESRVETGERVSASVVEFFAQNSPRKSGFVPGTVAEQSNVTSDCQSP